MASARESRLKFIDWILSYTVLVLYNSNDVCHHRTHMAEHKKKKVPCPLHAGEVLVCIMTSPGTERCLEPSLDVPIDSWASRGVCGSAVFPEAPWNMSKPCQEALVCSAGAGGAGRDKWWRQISENSRGSIRSGGQQGSEGQVVAIQSILS